MLVRWCLDAVSMSRALQFTVIWGADVVSFGAQTMSFGMLAIERNKETSDHTRGGLGVQAWMFVDFERILGPHVASCFVTFGTNKVFLVIGVSESASVCLGLQNPPFGVGVVAKNNFSHMSGFY